MSSALTPRRIALLLTVAAAALYLSQVDSCLVFLQAGEALDVVLSTSLAQGLGYREIALLDAPPHVREPPLFYLILAGIVRTVGVRVVLLKIVVVLSAALSMGLVFLLFARRASRPLAAAAAILSALAGQVVAFAGWLRPDFTFMLFFYAAALGLERAWAGGPPKSRAGWWGGLALAAAYLTRSLALALVIAWMAAMLLPPWRGEKPGRRLLRTLLPLLPFFLAWVLWTGRNHLAAQESGLTYSGRYLIDAPVGGSLITGEDFHTPLLPELPRISAAGLAARVAEQSWYYLRVATSMLTAVSDPPAGLAQYLAALAVAAVIAGWMLREARDRSPVGLMLPIYFLAVAAWPMEDPRLILPLLPFGFFYLLSFALWAGHKLAGRRPRLHPGILPAAVAAVFLALNLAGDYRILRWRQSQRYPVVDLAPGLRLRLVSPGRIVSFRLLLWARDHLPQGTVLMFHSPTAGWLVSGHEICPLPYFAPPEKIRAWLLQSRVDYILLDGWEQELPGGPAQFAPSLLSALERYPQNFPPIFRLEGSAAVYQVVRATPG